MQTTRRQFIQQLGMTSAAFALSNAFSLDAFSKVKASLPRSAPELQGMDSAGILAFLEAIAQSKHEFHSLMIVRHGQVVAEGWWAPYRADLRHTMYSMSKSFTSTAVGLAVAEGKLKTSDLVISFFPEELPSQVSDHLAALTIKDLLTMSVGHAVDPTGQGIRNEENWVKMFLALPIVHKPGSTFLYNSMATYMCSAIVQKVTGQKLIDYLKPRLFEPLGIEGADWEEDFKGINTGGWGLRVRTEDLAKFGQLYLQKGVWNGKQIIPKAWVEEATSFHIQQPSPAKPTRPKEDNDWLQGYGYQFWRCRHNAYRGDGAYGQYTIVMPDQDAVIAITSETPNMQGILDLVWTHLLPAMKSQPLPANNASAKLLKRHMSTLALSAPKGKVLRANAAKVSGQSFRIEPNPHNIESVSLSYREGDTYQWVMNDAQGTHKIICGLGKWAFGETDIPRPNLVPSQKIRGEKIAKIAASGVWNDPQTFEITIRYYESPHRDYVICYFEDDKIRVSFDTSINRMSGTKDKREPIEGRRVV
ncbi:serine hydrolase domain-containing protein [Runella zeae]|uniref:serine hydrolase domain-containing protein n=1 Tax=Runella zeae TaxID=94255 RepID=UPI000414492A|nr:serine hydrolase [Runella zeae]